MAIIIRSTFLYLIVILFHNYVHSSENIGKLPYCVDSEDDNGFVLVSTLDGKLSAISSDGLLLWDVETGPGPLLTSNIHNAELTNNGEWVRLIPALSGSLYKFNGKTIDAIPISADSLLKSSFMYASDLVIAGGRDVRTYGIVAKTGTPLYECTSEGCQNITQWSDEFEDVIVVERSTTIVRAHEPRTGSERWNFSVGNHNIKIPQSSCVNFDVNIANLNFSAVLPKGILTAYKISVDNTLWEYNFSSPIVKVWTWDGRDLFPVDLFDQARPTDSSLNLSPAIYLGMHQKQLYIHESMRMLRGLEIQYEPNENVIETTSLTKIPWKPISALKLYDNDDGSTAISVLYSSEYVNGKQLNHLINYIPLGE